MTRFDLVYLEKSSVLTTQAGCKDNSRFPNAVRRNRTLYIKNLMSILRNPGYVVVPCLLPRIYKR